MKNKYNSKQTKAFYKNKKIISLIVILTLISAGLITVSGVSIKDYSESKLISIRSTNINENNNIINQKSRSGNWWDNDWIYRMNISINSSMISNNLSGFPILINLNNSNFNFNHVQTNGEDIRFIDFYDNITEFPYEIEKWDSTSEKAVIWVNISNVSSTEDTIFQMYYGNNSAIDNQNVNDVWDSSFRLVQHLNETSGTHYDSTSNNNDGTCSGGVLMNVDGVIGVADDFAGDDDYVLISDDASLDLTNVFTLEGWMKSDLPQSGSINMQAFNKPNSYIHTYFHTNSVYRGTAGLKTNTASWYSSGGPVTITEDEWHHIAAIYDGTYLTTYVDGEDKSSNNIGSINLEINTDDFYIGCGYGAGPASFFDGIIDEVRVSSIARNNSWINATYQLGKNNLLDLGDEEIIEGINIPPILSSELPTDGDVNITLGDNILKITVNDTESDLMNITFKTNSSGSWTVIGSNNSVYNGTYQQIHSFPDYDTMYWWSISAIDPSGSGNWTNETYYFTTKSQPTQVGVHKFSVDHTSHIDYGLAYPVTYIFNISSDATNLKAFKMYPTGGGWQQITERNRSEIFSGVEAARFNYTEDKAYISASFGSDTDDLYIRITDSDENIVEVTFVDIPEYYDNRSVAVVITGDDLLTCPGCSDPDSTNWEFKNVADACQARNIWWTPGINSNGTIETGWYPNPDYGPNWTLWQIEVDEGFVELAAHGTNHPHAPYNTGGGEGYDVEIGGCKQAILENITMPSLNRRGSQEYLYCWIEPYGDSDSTARQKLGENKYICDRSTTGGVTDFSSWDATNGLYQRSGMTLNWEGASLSTLNSWFDTIYASGGIHHLYCHPYQMDFSPSGNVYQHLDYIANRSDVWYAGMGHLYLYHYMEERNIITHIVGTGNLTPSISFESPSNDATDVPIGTNVLEVNATDPEGDLIDITFRTNASASWADIGSNISVGTGVYQQTYDFTKYDTMYWWSVNATDPSGSGNWTNRTFSFTTITNKPQITNPLPSDSAIDIPISLSELSFEISDPQDDLMNFSVETNPDVGNQDNLSVPGEIGGIKKCSISNLLFDTEYHWYVNVSDGSEWSNVTFIFTTESAPGVWWNENWNYRKEITINHSLVEENLSNFPLLIKINDYGDSDLVSHAQENGEDIVFTDYSGNKLNHEIEYYNNVSGYLYAWVNVTELSSTEDNVLYMYYGNPSCPSQENASGVWDSSYRIVQHLSETSGIHYDSTINDNDGTVSGGVTMNADGIIDGGDDFDGVNGHISISNDPSLSLTYITVEAWVKTTTSEAVSPVISKDYDGGSVLFRLDVGTSVSTNAFAFFDGSWHTTDLAGNETDGYWHHLVGTFDGSALRYYVDGSLVDTVVYSASLPSNTASVYIGRYQTFYYEGLIDEVRVSNPVRNASWIKTEYRNQKNPETFYTIGSEESSGNLTPLLTDENPTNGATGITPGINKLEITVNDPEGDQMDVTFRTNASGSWNDIDTNSSVYDGTYSQTYSFNDNDKTFWWSVNATDPSGSGNWTNHTYHFTTEPLPRGWIYYRKIIFNHSLIDEDLTNFPILINISSDSELADHTQNNGEDIRFFDEINNSQFNHEIELFDSITGQLICWVNVTHLSSTQDTIIWMGYGNTTCDNQENPEGVWNSDYRLVQHLNETSGTHYDSTSFGNNGTCTGGVIMNADGIINGADNFTGSDYCEINDDSSLDLTSLFTLEGWLKPSSPQSGINKQPFNKPESYIYSYYHTAASYNGVAALQTSTNSWKSSGGPVTVLENTWSYIVGVYDGTYLKTYVNGVEQASTNIGSITLKLNDNTFLIGCGYGTGSGYTSYYDGVVDEVRVSSVARNSSWVKTAYNTVNSSDIFLLISEEILLSEDNIPPEITNIQVEPELQEINGFVNISCNVTDDEEVDEVRVNITYPDDSYLNETMLNGSYYYNSTYIQEGIYTFFIWANDTSGNSNKSSENTFNIINKSNYDNIILKTGWNIISLTFNQTINKNDIIISSDELYSWSDAVNENIILGFIYHFNRTSHSYEFSDSLEPGYGYWIRTNSECDLLINGSPGDDYITILKDKWNIMGVPDNVTLLKNNLIIQYNNTDYSWSDATTDNNEEGEPLILGFIYGWNRNTQRYRLSEGFDPGYGYWMYAFYECILKREVI